MLWSFAVELVCTSYSIITSSAWRNCRDIRLSLPHDRAEAWKVTRLFHSHADIEGAKKKKWNLQALPKWCMCTGDHCWAQNSGQSLRTAHAVVAYLGPVHPRSRGALSTMTLPGRARPRGRIWQMYFGRRGCLELSRGILHGQKSDGWEGKLCFYCPPHKPWDANV